MEFGKLQNVDDIDWSLTPTPAISKRLLESTHSQAQIFMGGPAWGQKLWAGRIYPEGTKPIEFLYFYSRSFNTIELNTSHYQIPNAAKTLSWTSQVPDNFLFCPKLYKGISHSRNGLIDKILVKEWLTFLGRLGSHLGTSFLQLPPYFSYENRAELFHFLKEWPDEFHLAVEFRHPSWFQNHELLEPLVNYLQSRNIASVITDVAGRRDVLHSSLSADFTFIRFIGNSLHPSDEMRAKMWAQRLKEWSSLKRIYLMLHEPDDILTPEMAQIFVEKLSPAFKISAPVYTTPRASQLNLGI